MRQLILHVQLHFCRMTGGFPFDIKAFSLCIVVVGGVISSSVRADPGVAGKVIAVIDGNTIEISSQDNRVHKVLLIGIDCPELGQEYGNEAKKFLEKIILKQNVVIQFKGKDLFGNQLAVVMMNGGVDPRIELLKEGLAWTSEKNPLEDLEPYRTFAQRKGRGLWEQENPVPPWTYRRQQSMVKPKIR